MSGTGKVKFMAAEEALATEFDDQYQFVLNAAKISLMKNDNGLSAVPTSENRTWQYIGTNMVDVAYPEVNRYWFYQAEFDLIQGNYTIELSVNQSPMSFSFPAPNQNTSIIDLSMTTDYFRVERRSADPLCSDCDGDSVIDGDEINHGSAVWNSDVDKDGLSDAQEIKYGTNPELKDSDFDGLRDHVELGLSGETDPYTIWDTTNSTASRFEVESRDPASPLSPVIQNANRSNDDADAGLTTTDPNNKDSDADGLPDGCIDGWSYNSTLDKYDVFEETGDNLHNFWEGEDLNLNGAVDAGDWNDGNGPGETNGTKWDTDGDGMPDGWEAWYRIDPLDSTGQNGAGGNCDNMSSYNAPWDFSTAQSVARPEKLEKGSDMSQGFQG